MLLFKQLELQSKLLWQQWYNSFNVSLQPMLECKRYRSNDASYFINALESIVKVKAWISEFSPKE